MRVRKRTSKRTSTRMREGIKKKATAQRKKERKQSKTDPTWRSKNKKDPGIPASFPYKAKILEEIEAKRLQDLEMKKLQKQKKIQAREEAVRLGQTVPAQEDLEEEVDGMAALVESAQQAAAEYQGGKKGSNTDGNRSQDLDVVDYDIDFDLEEDEEGASELEKSRKAYDKIFKTVVDASDVILYVLDARDPEGTRSRKVEQAVLQSQGKRLILILNKVDLIPPSVLEQWMNVLKSSFPTIPLRAAPGATNSSSFNKKLTQSATAEALLEALKTYANNKKVKGSIVVGVIGYPNVGKSSVINAITSRRGNNSKVCPVGNQAGVTTALREIKIDSKLKILDSPGICFPSEGKSKSKTEQEAELALLSALPPKYIVDPYPSVLLLIKRLSKSDEMTDSFKRFYEVPPIPANDADTFTKHFLIHVARKRGRLGKGGIANLASAGQSVLNDWRDGKFLGWVLPNASKKSAEELGKQQESSIGSGASHAPEKVEQTTIVSEWSKEFDLDALFSNLDNTIKESRSEDAMEE